MIERVRIGIATIEGRVDVLERTIESLYDQADEICVNLNGWSYVPSYLKRRKIIVNQTDNLGDLQKFIFLDGFDGYYLTCDDDIIYGPGYVEAMLAGIERYKREAVVGWHGSILKEPFADYYTRESRDVFTFRSKIASDRQMDVLGTGCMGFHTSTIKPAMSVFPRPSMADVFFALYARRKSVPLILLGHDANVLTPQATASSISDDSIAKKRSALNVRDRVNALTHTLLEVPNVEFNIELTPRDLNILIVGRTNPARWLKGGIKKSAVLMKEMLGSVQYCVELLEIESPVEDLIGKISKSPSEAMIVYAGDQNAQDFYAVKPVVNAGLEAGKLVIVNLSIDLDPSRTGEIVGFLNHFGNPPNLKVLTFSQSTEHLESFRGLSEQLILVPKSLEHMAPIRAVPFVSRRGIFLGDLGKMVNPRLAPNALEYLRALREALPQVSLDCVSQYASEGIDRDIAKLVNVIPYQNDIAKTFLGYRLYVHLFDQCTFEMLPAEAMSSGLPVLYRDMPHALNEYVGLNGLRFKNPEELAALASFAYHRETAWSQISRGGRLRGAANSWAHLGAQMASQIWLAVSKLEGLREEGREP